MRSQYVRRTNQSGQKDIDNGILQRTAVRTLLARKKALQVQTKSQALDSESLKWDLTQIPVSNHNTLRVQQKLMVGKESETDSQIEGLAIHEFRGLSSELISERVGGLSDRSTSVQRQEEEKTGENKTGLPDRLKAGIESLSGYDLSGVRVNYNSPKPAQVNALAYTQGQAIEIAPGQEGHLPHEAWHVVQQKQGRVRKTMEVNGVGVNGDRGLEREADVMGQRALQMRSRAIVPQNREEEMLGWKQAKEREIFVETAQPPRSDARTTQPVAKVIQKKDLATNKLNVAGENHKESGKRRKDEREYAVARTGGVYVQEGEFRTRKWYFFGSDRLGDPLMLRVEMLLAILKEKTLVEILTPFGNQTVPNTFTGPEMTSVSIETLWDIYKKELGNQIREIGTALSLAIEEKAERESAAKAVDVYKQLTDLEELLKKAVVQDVNTTIIPAVQSIIKTYAKDVLKLSDIRPENKVSEMRSKAMHEAAADNAARKLKGQKGVWKVGDAHIPEIKTLHKSEDYEILTREEFNAGFVNWLGGVVKSS
ncbi:MAG: DUF4157 domain-containing protein [Hormoscilla sp. GUM202]|nr:DUF4157 domain-containing protein [Hormoscilla sp. GUM202]